MVIAGCEHTDDGTNCWLCIELEMEPFNKACLMVEYWNTRLKMLNDEIDKGNKNGWHKIVDEKSLPPGNMSVITLYDDVYMKIAKYNYKDNDGTFDFWDGEGSFFKPTHWMFLPGFPKD